MVGEVCRAPGISEQSFVTTCSIARSSIHSRNTGAFPALGTAPQFDQIPQLSGLPPSGPGDDLARLCRPGVRYALVGLATPKRVRDFLLGSGPPVVGRLGTLTHLGTKICAIMPPAVTLEFPYRQAAQGRREIILTGWQGLNNVCGGWVGWLNLQTHDENCQCCHRLPDPGQETAVICRPRSFVFPALPKRLAPGIRL